MVVIAKYDYSAQGSQELDLKKNERLVLLDDSKHWWKVLNAKNQSGFVPSNYVKKEKPSLFDSIRKRVRKKTDSYKQNSSNSSPLASPIATKAVDINITPSPANSLPRTAISGTKHFSNFEGTTSETNYTKITAFVKYNYEAQQSDELSLVKGSKVIVMEKSSDGWWKGELNGSLGWFPSNYVCEETCEPIGIGINSKPHMPIPSKPKTAIDVRSDDIRRPVVANNGSSSPTTHCVLDQVIALYSFQSQNEEELSFQKSERLEIIERPANDPDWWKARNQSGQVGLVPKNYVQVISELAPQHEVRSTLGLSSPSIVQKNRLPIVSNDIPERVWYFGNISRGQCDQMLNEFAEDGDFVIRDSETNVSDFSCNLITVLIPLFIW